MPYEPSEIGRQSRVPAPLTRDQEALDRHTDEHELLLNDIAATLDEMGHQPQLPGPGSVVPFDLAVELGDRICVIEAKSLPTARATDQLRIALGQVLDYRWRLRHRYDRNVLAVIAVAARPPARWEEICAAVDVRLVFRPFQTALKSVLDDDIGAVRQQP